MCRDFIIEYSEEQQLWGRMGGRMDRGRTGLQGSLNRGLSLPPKSSEAGVAFQHGPQLGLGIWALMSVQRADIGSKLLWKWVWPWVTLFLQLRAIPGEHWELRALGASVGRVTPWHICAPGETAELVIFFLSCYLFFYFSELVWGICVKCLAELLLNRLLLYPYSTLSCVSLDL